MKPMRLLVPAAAGLPVLLCTLLVDRSGSFVGAQPAPAAVAQDPAERQAHEAEVMKSVFCAGCHPAIYAEHAQNTHGRAFTDEEARLATGRFDHGDCIRCHTPRPIFETGIGMNPLRRHHNLEEGNTCMTCHWKPDYDYGQFQGGAECKTAFHDQVGTVEACASCHRNHGTPYQWEIAPTGKARGRKCMTCHMQVVERPVAVGQPPSRVRSHAFPGARSEQQLRRAYDYEARIEGNEAVVVIANTGTGHNFPTELKQRSVESLIVVRDESGAEVSRSRMVFRDPYKRPYGMKLPVNTQIPAGESREHRVPIRVADGTVDCELHFKLYYPIEDHHPDLARRLEVRRLAFAGVTPSDKEVVSAPDVRVQTPEGIAAEAAGPAHLVDYARPPIGTVAVDVPEGADDATIAKLIEMFQFPVPEGNRRAQARLVEIGAAAVPALIEALGSWDNKTWKQAQSVLQRIGAPAAPALLAAMDHEQLYVRVHARELAARFAWGEHKEAALAALADDLDAAQPLDRAGAAETLGLLYGKQHAAAVRPLLADGDPDVVRAAARALALFDDREALPAIEAALRAAPWLETRRDLAEAAAAMGSPAGIPVLLEQLDLTDDLLREAAFEAFFAVTAMHEGYDPFMPRDERLAALALLQARWAESGGADVLRRPPRPDARTHAHAFSLVSKLGGGAGTVPGGDDQELVDELLAMGESAVPALIQGLKFPAGFDLKRARICECLGNIGSGNAAPVLASTLRDPVVAVAAWACWALESCGDAANLPALSRYQDRLLTLRAQGRVPQGLVIDRLLMQVARTRLQLGEDTAKNDLAGLLMSADEGTRRLAIEALQRRFGETRGYDPDAPAAERRLAAVRWYE